MLLLIEFVFPKWAFIVVGHVIAFAVYTFESVRAQFALFGFETRRV